LPANLVEPVEQHPFFEKRQVSDLFDEFGKNFYTKQRKCKKNDHPFFSILYQCHKKNSQDMVLYL